MNRLILIGNGFDRAHDLKTSYNDFIFDYLKNACLDIFDKPANQNFDRGKVYSHFFQDLLIELGFIFHTSDSKKNKRISSNFLEMIKEKISLKELVNFLQELNNESKQYVDIYSSVFLKKILKNCIERNWVDIENEYFDRLVDANASDDSIRNENILRLNNEFQYLKDKLVQYLKKINTIVKDIELKPELNKLFTEEILSKDGPKIDKNVKPSSLYFLNFNYTNTLDKYLAKLDKKIVYELNHIHGRLDDEINNPIIFGFGDELDKKYLEFEDLKKNELFTHIKSFDYSLTSNYHNLIRFIEAESFQVYILGHSCGVSDRTMLNRIFEHENCKSIKIFYYQKSEKEDDFTEKNHEISRHFKIKGDMRNKIVPKKYSRKMP